MQRNKKTTSRAGLAVCVLATLGLTAACGGGGAADTAAASDSGAKPMTKAELTKAALTKSDVKGWEINPMSAKQVAEGAGGAKAHRSACQPLAQLSSTKLDPKPGAIVYTTFASTASMDFGSTAEPDAGGGAPAGTGGMMRLASFEGDDAEQVLNDVKAAAEACKDGFEMTGVDGDVQKTTSVTLTDGPKVGDDVVTVHAVIAFDGNDHGVGEYVLVRSGSQVTIMMVTNLLQPEKTEIPQDLLKAQVAKLEKAAKG